MSSLDLAVADKSLQITDKDIGRLRLMDYQMALVLPFEHPLTAHKNIYLRVLDGQILILPQNCHELEPQLLRLCRQQTIEIRQIISVDAVKNGRVYPVVYSLAYTPGVRTGETVKLFLKALYGIED